MIYVYQSDNKIVRRDRKFGELLQELPPDMHEKALRYQFEVDGINFILGRLLLKRGLQDLGKEDLFEHITIQANGKPILNGINFNISHSGDLVVCAFSTEGEIGIDVEMEKSVELKNFRAWFTEREWNAISEASDPLRKFFWYWIRKESIIKALGINLSHLNRVEIDPTQDFFTENKKKWYLTDLDLKPGFFGALCSEAEVHGLQFLTIEF